MKPNHFKDLEQYDYSSNRYYLENSKNYLQLRQIVLTYQHHYIHTVLGRNNKELKKWIYDSTPLLQDAKYTWSTRCYWIMFGIYDFPKCYFDDCDAVFDGNVKFSIGYPVCCKNCNNRKDSPRTQHTRETNYERFGSYTNMGTELFKKQAIEGFLRNYGETNNMKSEKGLKEYQDALEEQYGVRNILQLDSAQQKAKNTKHEHDLLILRESIRRNVHVSPIFDVETCNDLKVGKFGWWQCLDCGHVFYDKIIAKTKEHIVQCPFCKIEKGGRKRRHKHSNAEYEIAKFIRQTYPELKVLHNTKQNWKIIPPKEIDIYMPELKFGIEYDGCYWHQSENYDEQNKILAKTEMCEAQGIHLMHIYEDEWKDSPEYVKALLSFFIEKQQLDTTQYTTLVLPHDKFPIFYEIDGFKLMTTITSHLINHGKYQVYDCGSLLYQRPK